jgi:hypothetical protein
LCRILTKNTQNPSENCRNIQESLLSHKKITPSK